MADSTSQANDNRPARRLCNAPGKRATALFSLGDGVLRLPLNGPIVGRGAHYKNKESPLSACLLAGMTVKEIHVPAGISAAFAAAMAIAIGFAGPAVAQQPPTSSGFAVQGSRSSQATIYEDAVSGDKFTFEQRGREGFAKFANSGEVVALEARPAQRGDIYFFNDAGEPVFKLTEQGNLISFLGNKNGVPAEAAGYSQPFA